MLHIVHVLEHRATATPQTGEKQQIMHPPCQQT